MFNIGINEQHSMLAFKVYDCIILYLFIDEWLKHSLK